MEFSDGVVRFRALEQEDLENLRKWINHPETSRYLSMSWPISFREQMAWFQKICGDASKKKFLLELVAGESIGLFSMTNIDSFNRSVEIGVTIGEAKHRGQGLALRSLRLALDVLFGHFNYHRVWAHILETNEACLKLFDRAGFKKDGFLRESIFWEDRMIGAVIVSKLRDEYYMDPVKKFSGKESRDSKSSL